VTELVSEKPGDRIGRYKLLEKIGEGGCGVVYMAEQEEPVRRRVALKVIKLGMDTKQVIARFEAERQALALMDHPNIAKVLDGGATPTGRPYFVMELVRGVRITEFCDEARLSTEARLRLFVQVCQAVQHAHQKGIIHRDLKPSNILVTVNDGAPVPKVIDFGIAKATGQRLTDKTVVHAVPFVHRHAGLHQSRAGEMSSVDIDTRSDIYSLGVLLYELLIGRTPFDGEELLRSGLDEMRRILRETEPLRPSTRLGTLSADELTTSARRRHTEPPKLIHLVRGDLDWIVMKALEKDRTRRYETAERLGGGCPAAPRQRAGHCPPAERGLSLPEIGSRNKLAFAAGTAVAMTLVFGVVASTWQAVRATKAEQEATFEGKRAEEQARLAAHEAPLPKPPVRLRLPPPPVATPMPLKSTSHTRPLPKTT
jgi:serine/threonine protein kinase